MSEDTQPNAGAPDGTAAGSTGAPGADESAVRQVAARATPWPRRRRLRQAVRAAALAAAVCILVLTAGFARNPSLRNFSARPAFTAGTREAGPGGEVSGEDSIGGAPPWPAAVSSLSPFVAIASLLANRAIQGLTWLGFMVAAVALVRRRWFCRWACPTGLCADGAAMLGLRWRRRRRCPAPGRHGLQFPALGRWTLLLTLGGACAGYPLFLWLDPLAIFSSPFGALRARGASAAAWSAALMTFVLLSSFLSPGAWCGRLCPLGSLQDLLAGAARSAGRRLALSRQEETVRPRHGLPRRALLGGIAGLLWAAGTRWARGAEPGPLRPPGAAGEERFTGLCIRCGNCGRACPASIIRPDLGEHGLAGFLAPKLDFREDYCREDCTRCTEVCPSGAIVPVKPEDKARVRIGLPRVDMSSCLLGDDRECSACRNRCPYEAIRFVYSEAEHTLTPHVEAEKCPGCGACEAACPAAPVKAIVIVPRQDKVQGRRR